jgi:uncharacterized protein (TIGR02246 family)
MRNGFNQSPGRSAEMTDEGCNVASLVVRKAYDRLMSAFVGGDTDAYFDCFHDDASFIFPGEPSLESLAEYRSAWARWEQEGLRFTDVVADDVRIRVTGDTAVVTHRMQTTTIAGETTTVERERETIVFSKQGDRWLAVHEHMSPEET